MGLFKIFFWQSHSISYLDSINPFQWSLDSQLYRRLFLDHVYMRSSYNSKPKSFYYFHYPPHFIIPQQILLSKTRNNNSLILYTMLLFFITIKFILHYALSPKCLSEGENLVLSLWFSLARSTEPKRFFLAMLVGTNVPHVPIGSCHHWTWAWHAQSCIPGKTSIRSKLSPLPNTLKKGQSISRYNLGSTFLSVFLNNIFRCFLKWAYSQNSHVEY